MASESHQGQPEDETTTGSISVRSGGVNAAGDLRAGGDVVGRDKVESAGGHIIHAEPGATVIVGAPPAPAAPAAEEAPAPGEPPFKGLQYFDEKDADLFYGREALTAKLVGRLRDAPSLDMSGEGWGGGRFLAIVGASGSGKSSLVRAGLVPALRRGEPLADGTLPPAGSARWPIHVITPTAHPLKELAATLTRESESVTATATLMDDLARDARSLDLAASRFLKQSGSGNRLVLVVDQFEELFTACKDEAERRMFVDNLMVAVATDGPMIVVLTLRADFYAHCAQYDNLREALARRQEYIGPMSADELRRAIEEPAGRGEWEFEPGLVDLLLRDVGDEPGALPLLSHALLETWKRRRGRTMTLAGYHESGGVHGAIAKTADAIFNQLRPEQQAIARNIFLRLTELGEGTQDTRRRVLLSELTPRAEDQSAVEAVLKTLADARLVTTQRDVAEVAHEALIREWPVLRNWLDENREGLRIHRQLTEDARDWIDLNRDPDALYRGARLAAAGEWADKHADDLNALEREFLGASLVMRQREREEIEERRRKELEDARKLGEAAKARAQAERRAVIRTRLLLAVTLVVTIGLSLQPLYQFWLRQQALDPLMPVAGGEVQLGGHGDGALLPRLYAIETFAIEPYEVTNRRYRLCMQAGVCSPPNAPKSTYSRLGSDEYPMVNVTALQAAQFCEWLGLRLPTDQEWERAARHADGRLWPWGDDPPSPERANFYFGSQHELVRVGQTRDGVSEEGIYDLAGNVWEWTRSPYEFDDPVWEDTSMDPPVSLSLRGGGADTKPEILQNNIAFRVSTSPIQSNPYIGFRCAVSR